MTGQEKTFYDSPYFYDGGIRTKETPAYFESGVTERVAASLAKDVVLFYNILCENGMDREHAAMITAAWVGGK